MAQFFTLRQAETLLPEIESAVREAISLKAEFQAADLALKHAMHRIGMLGGALVNPERLMTERSRREASVSALKEAIERVQSYGCLVKDLDIGLIDFPTLFKGQEVYLCWKLGEDGISFWHGVDEGFRGRKPIDQEFLDNHRGDSAN